MTKNRINKLLLSAKLKRTESRKTILEILIRTTVPMSAEEIIIATGKTGPNRVTVYRTLETMVAAGIVHRAFVEGRSQYYELSDKCSEKQCHPHFVCSDCGRTQCLPNVSIPMASSIPAGFTIHRQKVQLEGLCPKCNIR